MAYQIMKSTPDALSVSMLSDVPDHDLAIPGSTNDSVLVEPDSTCAKIGMTRQHFHNLVVRVVPDSHGCVRTAGQHLRLIW